MPKNQHRKRGAQPGNTNAVIHGFYAQQLKVRESRNLATAGAGLVDEIGLLRVIIRRVMEACQDANSTPDLMGLMNTMGQAGVRLAAMLRTQAIYFERTGDEEMTTLLNAALTKFREEEAANELTADTQPADVLPAPAKPLD